MKIFQRFVVFFVFNSFMFAFGLNLHGQDETFLKGNENTSPVPLNLNEESSPEGTSASSEEHGQTGEHHTAGHDPHGTSEVAAHPNRPSVSDSPKVLPAGQLQIEYGWLDSWLGGGEREKSFGGMFRFGLARNFEVRWAFDPYTQLSDPLVTESGVGDTLVGAQYQFLAEDHEGGTPAMAFSYMAKLPTASEPKGLGSGRTDHFFSYLLGKELWGMEMDFNGVYRVIGRHGAPGYDANGIAVFTFGRNLAGPVGFIGEFLGESRLNSKHDEFATTLWALTYRVTPRFYLDAGIEAGLTSHAPRKHLIFGFTYAIGNLYRTPGRRRASH